jgi:hypothetical protein
LMTLDVCALPRIVCMCNCVTQYSRILQLCNEDPAAPGRPAPSRCRCRWPLLPRCGQAADGARARTTSATGAAAISPVPRRRLPLGPRVQPERRAGRRQMQVRRAMARLGVRQARHPAQEEGRPACLRLRSQRDKLGRQRHPERRRRLRSVGVGDGGRLWAQHLGQEQPRAYLRQRFFLRLYTKHDRFTKTCSGRIQENLNKTGPFSQVVHATAPSMDDAFVFKDEALPVWAHNAAPVRAPKTHTACPGCYYLFHIGAGKYTSPPEKCSGGHGPDADAAGSSSAAALPAAVAAAAGPCVGLCNKSSSLVHRSHGPEGPWEPLPSIGGARGEHTCYVCICFVPSLSWQSHRLSRDNLQSGCIETGLRCMCDFVVPCRDRLQQPRTCVCKERCGQTKQQQR